MADEVPPLEDVPEVLEKIQQTKKTTKKTEEASIPGVPEKRACSVSQKSAQNMSSNFCGMKKGFLFGGPTKGKKSGGSSSSTSESSKSSGAATRPAEDMPMIRARPENSSLVFKEVQKAMDANNAMEFQDKLAKRLDANSHIRDVLSDPAWIPILDEFQHDPETAMKKYKDNAEVRSTLKELCNVLGDTFLHMNSKIQSEEELLSSELMENPQVKEALMDPLVQQMMVYMKQGTNDKVQRCFQLANPKQRRHIQILIDVGLFAFAL